MVSAVTNGPLVLTFGDATDAGPRDRNEDRVGVPQRSLAATWNNQMADERGWLCAVADGVGGNEGGEVASDLAVRQLFSSYYSSTVTDPEVALRQAVESANGAVFERGQAAASRAAMGTTLVAALVIRNRLIVANVGDSRAYLVRNRQAKQLTQDHSLMADQLRAGLVSEQEARRHSLRNVITRSVGGHAQVDVDTFQELLNAGDRIVLCSDGVHGVLTNDQIATLTSGTSVASAARKLVSRSVAARSQDNATALVVAVDDAGGAGGGVNAGAGRAAGGRLHWLPAALAVFVFILLAGTILTMASGGPRAARVSLQTPALSATARRAQPEPTPSQGEARAAQATSVATVTLAPTNTRSPTSTATVTSTPSRTSTRTASATRTRTSTRTPTTVVIRYGDKGFEKHCSDMPELEQGGYENGKFGWVYAQDASSKACWATWTIEVPADGRYLVSANVPSSGVEFSTRFGPTPLVATTSAPYTIGGHGAVKGDQESSRGSPLRLGEFQLRKGRVSIKLSDRTQDAFSGYEKPTNNRVVLFDAIIIEWAGPFDSETGS